MFTMMLWLSVCSALVELFLIFQCRWALNLIGRWAICGLLVSLGLSVLLGLAFGAGGLIALGAGVMSTVWTAPVYLGIHIACRLRDRWCGGAA